MDFFETIGLITFLYYLINAILWFSIDCDVELFYKERFGISISSLKGKVVWVTGASSGIGKALAIKLAEHNVKLCISARRVDRLEEVKKECLKVGKRLQPNDVLVLQMDMTDIGNQQKCFDQVAKHFGEIDVLVNNAGRSQRALFKEIELDVDKELFDLDVFSIVNLTRIYVRHFGGKGHVVVTSSTLGFISTPNSASYTAAKHAIHGYYETLKMEEPDLNVTIFCPGPTFSEFLETAYTGQKGHLYGKPVQPTDKRMTAERCAHLMATSIANKCLFNFVGPFPLIPLIYFVTSFPNLGYYLWLIIGKKGAQHLRDTTNKEN